MTASPFSFDNYGTLCKNTNYPQPGDKGTREDRGSFVGVVQ